MLNRRVQVRYDDSDIEDAENSDWLDEADHGADSAPADPSRANLVAKSKATGPATREHAYEASDDVSDDASNPSSDEGEVASESGDDDSEDPEDGDVAADLASISFGALARAQRSLKRKRDEPESAESGSGSDDDEPDTRQGASRGAAPRNAARLAEIKTQLQALSADSTSSFAESLRIAREKRKQGKGSDEHKSRSSKHAPTEMSSKKAVSRRRVVVELPADTTRDPRFDRLGASGTVDKKKIERNYAFLDEYRDSEIKTLRQEVAKEKNPDRKEQLQKTLQSLESKREAKRKQLERDKILAEHKKKEREAIAQGKKPFYLKKSEQKKLVLTSQFANMGQKQRTRAIERKRKKIASKEKKRMPWSRRTAGGPED
ncbi:rRNA biogenesis protein rrp36 [Orbilia brochopaga]|uniref:rRNA biogenesis protein RRP36 n=1 Tax=Orbilia brochopaga TaxID=3140254 RepID=A0AAV9UVQ2_9PEZI